MPRSLRVFVIASVFYFCHATAAESEVNRRQFGVKAFLSPSIFFITRASVNERDLDRVVQTFDSTGAPLVQRNPIKAMRGAPFPGMTFGITAFHRGLTTVKS